MPDNDAPRTPGSERPCKYCGFVASRMSDEDCPANPANRTPGREAFARRMFEAGFAAAADNLRGIPPGPAFDRALAAAPREQPERVEMADKRLLSERYWCGCERQARWNRCDDHGHLSHDEEPPTQLDPPTTARRSGASRC